MAFEIAHLPLYPKSQKPVRAFKVLPLPELRQMAKKGLLSMRENLSLDGLGNKLGLEDKEGRCKTLARWGFHNGTIDLDKLLAAGQEICAIIRNGKFQYGDQLNCRPEEGVDLWQTINQTPVWLDIVLGRAGSDRGIASVFDNNIIRAMKIYGSKTFVLEQALLMNAFLNQASENIRLESETNLARQAARELFPLCNPDLAIDSSALIQQGAFIKNLGELRWQPPSHDDDQYSTITRFSGSDLQNIILNHVKEEFRQNFGKPVTQPNAGPLEKAIDLFREMLINGLLTEGTNIEGYLINGHSSIYQIKPE